MRWGLKPQGWEKNHREIGAPHNRMDREISGMSTYDRRFGNGSETGNETKIGRKLRPE